MSQFSTEFVIAAAGGVKTVSRTLGISQQAVYQWFDKGIPMRRVQAISKLSGIAIEHLLPEVDTSKDQQVRCPYCRKEAERGW